jgi:hypothetical protein
MKIFFSSPIKGVDEVKKYIEIIDKALDSLGHKRLDNIVERINDASFYNKLDKGGKEAHQSFFEKTIKGIKDADITIFECSTPSLGIGFQIEKSLDYNKPTIILYFKDNLPHFITGTDHDKLIVHGYNEKNIHEVVSNAIEEARHAADKRFNFFISPSLLSYLEEESSRLGLTKSSFIRNLILEHRKKNKKT